MKPRNPKEASDDAQKSYYEAIKALRERHIRAHAIQPRPDNPEELEWARQGPRQEGT